MCQAAAILGSEKTLGTRLTTSPFCCHFVALSSQSPRSAKVCAVRRSRVKTLQHTHFHNLLIEFGTAIARRLEPSRATKSIWLCLTLNTRSKASSPGLQWLYTGVDKRLSYYLLLSLEVNHNLMLWKCGIPQESLLGPRLFSFYVNDFPDQIKEGEIDMYAHDTTLFYTGPSVDVVCEALNRILGDVHNWCRNNKLTIHTGKSEVMVLNRNRFCGPLKPVTLRDKILRLC